MCPRAVGRGRETAPRLSNSMRAEGRPRASNTADIPVFAARTKGRPCATARNRASARCWCGPALRPNQPSFVRLTSMSGRGLVRALALPGPQLRL